MKAIVLEINGKEVVLSMEELKLIVGEHFARKNIQLTTTEQNSLAITWTQPKSHFDETYDTVPVVVKYENNN